MKIGDLVRNRYSVFNPVGVIIGWSDHYRSDPREGQRDPVVLWANGRRDWIMRHKVEVVSESR